MSTEENDVYPREIIETLKTKATFKNKILLSFVEETYLSIEKISNIQGKDFILHPSEEIVKIFDNEERLIAIISQKIYDDILSFRKISKYNSIPPYSYVFGTRQGKKTSRQSLHMSMKIAYRTILNKYTNIEKIPKFSYERLLMSFMIYTKEDDNNKLQAQIIRANSYTWIEKKLKRYNLSF